MRILFVFAGGSGHAEPLVPLARAAQDAGHEVAFGGRPAIVATLEARGFAVFGLGRDATVERIPLRPLDQAREDRVFRDGFAGWIAHERQGAVRALCGDWGPDVVVCDETDFGAMIAAEELGVPHATVLSIASGSFVRAELVAEPLDALRAERGLPPDPHVEMPARHLVLSPFPPSFRDPAFPPPATTRGFRAVTPRPRTPHARPAVYFTLGTVFNVESGDLFSRVLAGLRELPVDVVVTVGPHVDPEELGPQPEHVRVERYLPQDEVLPGCDVVVTHGGSGSILGALAHGLPLVVVPMGADQPLNAARCEALGAGRVLDALRAKPADVRTAVAAVLDDPSYRQAAERLRDEIAALPEPAEALKLVERL